MPLGLRTGGNPIAEATINLHRTGGRESVFKERGWKGGLAVIL